MVKITIVNEYQSDFVANLKFYRKQKNISQAKLAELCECSTSTIGCIESFRQYPSFDLLIKIADALQIHPADLFLRDCSKQKEYKTLQKYATIIHKLSEVPENKKENLENIVTQICDAYTAHSPAGISSKS